MAASFFGKHVTRPKAAVLFFAAVLMSLAPILMGLRCWADIPEIIATGLTDIAGNDDPLPRWALVFALPGLAAVLTVICHAQLYIHQTKQTVPKASIRLLGRWVIPLIGLFFCSWAISSCAGSSLGNGFILVCGLGVLLVLLGAQLFDCKESAAVCLNFGYAKRGADEWRLIHRFGGCCAITAGLLIILLTESLGFLPMLGAAAAVLLLIAPVAYCAVRA